MPNTYIFFQGDRTAVFCTECQQRYELSVSEKQVRQWQAGEPIQKAMPDLPPCERELFISGTCDRCWRKMFGDH
jgi:hypothetical protein